MVEGMHAGAGRRTLDELLEAAEARINRLEPSEALAAFKRGALLIDIRSDLERNRDGIVSGSLHIPRTVLEWRLAPDSQWRSPHVGGARPTDSAAVRPRLLLHPRRRNPRRARLRRIRSRDRRFRRLARRRTPDRTRPSSTTGGRGASRHASAGQLARPATRRACAGGEHAVLGAAQRGGDTPHVASRAYSGIARRVARTQE